MLRPSASLSHGRGGGGVGGIAPTWGSLGLSSSDGSPPWVELAVMGRSNVGKSTLLNALLGGRDGAAAFVPVSKRPGTTVRLDFYGVGSGAASSPLVLVDTPGRGHRDTGRIGEIAEVLRAVQPDETCLVLPGSAGASTLRESVTAFAPVGASRVVLSKLDEGESLGSLVDVVRSGGIPAGWFTTGQEVPDDLERADARAFAERLVGGAGA